MKSISKIRLRINKEWFIYFSAFILLILLAFLSSCHRQTQIKTAHQSRIKNIIQDVLDDVYEPAEKHFLRLSPVHFATDSDELLSNQSNVLEENVSWLKKNPHAVIVLEGHCDERGEDHYNMELGDRRARKVKSELMKSDINADRLIMVVSYGELRPIDHRHNALAWKTNRRVEFIVR